MTKKNKTKKKGAETSGEISIHNPCGDYCDVQEGHLCPECADWADLRDEKDKPRRSDPQKSTARNS